MTFKNRLLLLALISFGLFGLLFFVIRTGPLFEDDDGPRFAPALGEERNPNWRRAAKRDLDELDFLIVEAKKAGASDNDIENMIIAYKTAQGEDVGEGSVQVGGGRETPNYSVDYFMWRLRLWVQGWR